MPDIAAAFSVLAAMSWAPPALTQALLKVRVCCLVLGRPTFPELTPRPLAVSLRNKGRKKHAQGRSYR